jgi:hypothetical protein
VQTYAGSFGLRFNVLLTKKTTYYVQVTVHNIPSEFL